MGRFRFFWGGLNIFELKTWRCKKIVFFPGVRTGYISNNYYDGNYPQMFQPTATVACS